MTKDGGRRIAIAGGAMLADPARLDDGAVTPADPLFEPAWWRARGLVHSASRGRGSAWFVAAGTRQWVLRHFRRGGWLAVLAADRYVWTGEARVRSFAEWRLLATLSALELPVPQPVAARYQRGWLTYRCDLITQRLGDGRPLSDVLVETPVDAQRWRAIGAAIARLHRAGVDHADLNAHNLLIDSLGAVSIIDFDRGRLRAAGRWRSANLRRLHRSLVKITAPLPPGRFLPADWANLLAGYEAPLAEAPLSAVE
jgi:3-deoxy-D-manno-octulosonic acid kinase